MNNPIRVTVIFAVVSGLLAMILMIPLYGGILYLPVVKGFLWLDLVLYALFLSRWSRVSSVSILFPSTLLLGAAFWPNSWTAFHALAVSILSWIRSGICFRGAPFRTLMAEIITVGGGITLVSVLGRGTPTVWPIGLLLFILIQALYFYMVPANITLRHETTTSSDSFEHARREAETVLDNIPR